MREAKTQLWQLLLRVSMGEEDVIARTGKLVARLVPLDTKPVRRMPGSAQGQVERLPILTGDPQFTQYAVTTVWRISLR